MGRDKNSIEIRTGAGGETAYIAGTRVRVSDVARLYQLMQDEILLERMQQSIPTLSKAQLAAALDYWRTHEADIESEIQEENALHKKLSRAG